VAALDPGLAVFNIASLDERVARSLRNERLLASLSTAFAALATLLAMVGVYGVMAYTVSQRTAEIGVRMAVGASPNRVVAMVVWQGARLAVMGVVLGLMAAALAAGAMKTLLFNVKGIDPLTFAAAPLVLGLAALLASYIPARRAARISPLAAVGR
jgi:ABC-type antimicrobial peptide transport system permease subunit